MSQNHDFLEGIDEQFQQQMKLYGNGNGNGNGNGRSGRSGARSRYHGVTRQIADLVERLSTSQKEEVLEFIYSLKPKAD